jgi:hypothetical protein
MKSRIGNLLIIVVCIVGFPFGVQAQENAVEKAMHTLRQMTTRYQQAKYLSFDVVYRYATEEKPAVYLDSLKGQYKLHGSRYWSLLDNRESMFDDNLLLMRFEEDSLMYIAAPRNSSGAPAMLDTMLFANKEAKYDYAETPSEQVITMTFNGQAPCRRIAWHIDRATGYLTKMVSLVRAEQLYDPSVRSLISEAAASCVMVETIYANYRQGAFTDNVFDMRKYIKKEGQEYVTVAPYEKYKVFIGTPGL